jgi:hypothetical protein
LIDLKDCRRTNPRNIGTSIPLVFDGNYAIIWDRYPPNLRPYLWREFVEKWKYRSRGRHDGGLVLYRE